MKTEYIKEKFIILDNIKFTFMDNERMRRIVPGESYLGYIRFGEGFMSNKSIYHIMFIEKIENLDKEIQGIA
jgi:hypothetical protein